MVKRKNILAINGSASKNSSNLALINRIANLVEPELYLKIFDDLTSLPHFETELTDVNVPDDVVRFRNQIMNADGILICTPEYVFSIPSGLKNAIEWCVSTTVLSNKPVGLITASASGLKGHEELKLIMKTLETIFTQETTLLIQGIKGKIDKEGNIIDDDTDEDLNRFVHSFKELIRKVDR